MSNRIEQYDLIAKEALGTVEDAKSKLLSTLETMKLLAQEGVKFNQSFKKPKGLEATVKGTKKVRDNTNKLVTAEKELTKQQDVLVKSEAKRIASMSKTNKEIVKSRGETTKNNTAIRKQIQLQETTKGSLNRLEKELSQNIAKYKNLTAAERANQKVGGQLLTTIQKQDKAVKGLNGELGRAQGNVGNYGSAMKNVGKQMVGALGVVGGMTAFVSVMRSATKTVMDFSVAQSDLAALSGKTAEQLAGLKQQSLELGASTMFTATQVTYAQVELVKMGLAVQEIEKATPSILNFAAATGSEIPAAAKTAAVAMKAFGLEASDMREITASLAVATTKSALNFEDYNTILSTLGPVARAYGFSLEDTIALTGKLKDAGFDASSAATATKKILLNLADGNGKLAQSLDRPIQSIDDLGSALTELDKKGVDLAESLELTDVRSVAAFNTFLKTGDALGEMKDSITGVADELDVMTEKKLDNLSGDVKIMGSAWEGFLLSIEDGTGVFADMSRGIVRFLTKILDGLTSVMGYKDVIGTILSAMAAYFVALKTQVLWAKKDVAIKAIQNIAIKLQAKLTGRQAVATKGAAVAQKGLNRAMSANIFAAVATAVFLIVKALIKMNKEAVEARIDTKALNEEIANESREANNLFEVLKKTEPGSLAFNETKEKLNKLYPVLLKHYDLETGSLEEIEAAQRAVNNEVLISVAQKQKQADIQEVAEKANEKYIKATEKLLKLADNPAQKGALAAIVGDVSAQIKAGSMGVDEGTKKIANFLEVPEKKGLGTNSKFLNIAMRLYEIKKQSGKLKEATKDIRIFYDALTGKNVDFKSAFEFIDNAKTTEQLNEYLAISKKALKEKVKNDGLSEKQTQAYLDSTYGKIKEEADKRKVLIEDLNVAKPMIDKAKSEKELEDYLKSTNDLVKKYAEQRAAQLALAEGGEGGEGGVNDKAEEEAQKRAKERAKERAEFDKPMKLMAGNKSLDVNVDTNLEKVNIDYEAFWIEQKLKLKENAGLFSDNAEERQKAEEELTVKLLELQKEQLEAELISGNLSLAEQGDVKDKLFDLGLQIHDQRMSNLDAEQQRYNKYLANISGMGINAMNEEQIRLQNELENFKGTAEEKEKIERKLAGVKAELDEDEDDRRKKARDMSIELAGQAFGAISGIYDAQASRLEASHDREVASTEEGSAARIAADAKYDKEKRKIDRKQAILSRAEALFNIGVSTARAIMAAVAAFPLTGGAPWSIIAGAIGAAQIAAVLAKPMPAFEKGGTVLEDTLARVSEKGSELAIPPGGGMFMTPENETVMPLQRGTEIIPHDETQRYLARKAYAGANVEMGRTNKILEQIRDNSPETIENGYRYSNKRGIKGKYKV